MSLYSDWRQVADAQRAPHEQEQFWNAYFDLETENYKKILANHTETYAGELKTLAETFGMDEVTFLGFLDGINTSLKQELDLESLESSTAISLDVDFEKLYFNTNTTTAIAVAEARGVILLAARHRGLGIFEYTPLQVKSAVTGYGKAEKRQVMEMVKSFLSLRAVPKPDDTADALALAICHAHSAGSGIGKI